MQKASGTLLLSAVTALLGGKGLDGAQLTQDVVKRIVRAIFGG